MDTQPELHQQRAERRYEAIGDLGACSLNRDGFKEAKLAIEAGEAHAHALWEILKEPTDRDAYMIRPLPWEGPGEYQYVHFHDGTHRYIKVNGFMGIVFEVHGPCKGEPKPEPRNVIVEHAKQFPHVLAIEPHTKRTNEYVILGQERAGTHTFFTRRANDKGEQFWGHYCMTIGEAFIDFEARKES